ncbi:cytochrome c oxidase-assembly factor cox-23, mitochondrial [Drechmeria coniospora]|uniref:Cytochrome c oxidase-assembly factor cox-23, mitochondrial n=1 Tax=Drechmeria coniospora TaxID=98403 RepID=A0A151GGA8_DRECN|nr:cytochrome c oxidase-assembly factor cox-23, mitochondrial [Drechmeria coniospora]KYK56102.1 cytochrome c oxidase-assembly factor cox-23, mitochondrial [Drechmeria coniospora]
MAASTPQDSREDPWDKETKQKFETADVSKSKSEYYDPCQEAAQRSYKCLYRNGGDKSMCGDYFQCVPDAVPDDRRRTRGRTVEG